MTQPSQILTRSSCSACSSLTRSKSPSLARSSWLAKPVMEMLWDCWSGAGTWILTWTKTSSVSKQKCCQENKNYCTKPVNGYLKFIHHLPNPTSFLSNDVAMKLKRHFHFNGNRNQSLKTKTKHLQTAPILWDFTTIFHLPYDAHSRNQELPI